MRKIKRNLCRKKYGNKEMRVHWAIFNDTFEPTIGQKNIAIKNMKSNIKKSYLPLDNKELSQQLEKDIFKLTLKSNMPL